MHETNKSNNQINKVKLPFLKRFFDVFFSLIIIVIFFPVFVLIFFGLIIEHLLRLEWPLPFYIEKRVSQGKKFNLIKFNPFRPALIRKYQQENRYFYTKGKERNLQNLTLIGRVLQRTYFDELPQFFTIFIGNMTLVGPRPVNLTVHQKNLKQGIYTKEIFKAGLTGAYQAHKGEKNAKQHELDMNYIAYVQNHNELDIIKNDFKLIRKTILILIKAKGL